MDKRILSYPKFLLKRYAIDHFNELSVDNYFLLVQKGITEFGYYSQNEQLRCSSEVLKHVLNTNIEDFREFDETAFNKENIEILASSNYNLSFFDLQKYPILFSNKKIFNRAIDSLSVYEINDLLLYVSSDFLTDDIIKKIEAMNLDLSLEVIEKHNHILKNNFFLKKSIKQYPNIIMNLDYLNEDIVRLAFDNGFVPTKEEYEIKPELKNYSFLVYESFLVDPSLIIWLKRDILLCDDPSKQYAINSNLRKALKQGVEITEQDLLNNNDLCSCKLIMDYVVSENPRLITLINPDCYIEHSILFKALQEYKVTKEDLEKHPNMCKNAIVMSFLPQYKLYSTHLSEDEKSRAIFNCLLSGKEMTSDTLPFFLTKYGSNVDINKIALVGEFLNISIDEENMDEQQKYASILDRIIDNVIEVKYYKNKQAFQFSDIIKLDTYITYQFENITNIDDFDFEFLIDFTGGKREYIIKNIKKFYKIYLENGYLDLSLTSDFYNKILNEHRNHYFNGERSKILFDLSTKLDLSFKKKNSILNGIRIKRAGKFISCKEFHKLGITEKIYNEGIKELKNSILNNKKLKKSEIFIDEKRLDFLIEYFNSNGNIDFELTKRILSIDDDKSVQFVVDKFVRMLSKYASVLVLREIDYRIINIKREKLKGLNYNDYLIASKERICKIISKILVKLDNKQLDIVINNMSNLKEILYLIPFVGLFSELDVDNFIDILTNYDKVREKIGITGGNISVDMSLSKLNDLITLSYAYANVDDVSPLVFGSDIMPKLIRNIEGYSNCYRMMLSKKISNIPPVYLATQDYIYESGVYTDPYRLLIGKVPKDYSCIDMFDLKPTGMYKEVLTSNTGDVILIRNRNNELISRIFVNRRGNVIQLATSGGENIDIEVYKLIANQMMEAAIKNNDNIDYIFVNGKSVTNIQSGKIIDKRFSNNFPHADLDTEAYLLASTKDYDLGNVDFEANPQAIYSKVRKPILYEPTNSDINRIRALTIFLEENGERKKFLIQNFEPFYDKDYSKVICGEDWYLAVKKDGSIDEFVLPIADIYSLEEISKVKSEILDSKIK